MRKLIRWNLMTLNGYLEGAGSWDLGWHEPIWGKELERFSIEQLHSADALLSSGWPTMGWPLTAKPPRARPPIT